MASSFKRKMFSAYITPQSRKARLNSSESVSPLDSRSCSVRARLSSPNGRSEPRTRPRDTRTIGFDNQSYEIPDDENLGQVIAALDMRDSGTVGCAYYSTDEEKLYLLGDIQAGGTEIIGGLILQMKPTVLLVSTRVDHFDTHSRQAGLDNESSVCLPYLLDTLPSQEFSYASAKSKLISFDLPYLCEQRLQFLIPHNGIDDVEQLDAEDVGFTLQEGKFLRMSSSVDMENTVTIGCAGALLAYIQRRRATGMNMADGGSESYQIRSIEMFGLEGTMVVSGTTLLSLQVIQPESHPSMLNQGPGKKSSTSKEGLSVYGIFRRFAHTPQGRSKLRKDFLRPSVNIDVITERHNFIGVFLRPDNYSPLSTISKSLKHIKNLRPVMVSLRKGVSTGSARIIGFKTTVWATLLAFAFYGIDIHDALREITGGDMLALRIKAIRAFDAAQLYKVGRMIQEIVDIDSSEEQNRTAVKPGLDKELDRMKDTYDGLNSLLKHVAIEIAATIPEDFDIDVNVIYFPQLGFNIAIPLNEQGEAAYNGSDNDWELMFVTENRAYFKDFRMREMDGTLGDIYGLICEKEIEIVYNLAQQVLEFEDLLIEASDVCGELDSILAMTEAASFYKLVRPKMVQENIIKIKGGRHLLQEMTVSSYVPNDTLLVGGKFEAEFLEDIQETPGDSSQGQSLVQKPSMLLLTGPNYSGKSVYMKQVALIVYLAQIGSFVPAESADLGITDKILVKMNTQESVSKTQSTFMNDLQQISLYLKQATGRSLLIIDEFGKGTNESDGIGLACGVLEYLLSLTESPKVIAITHFHEIFENGFLSSCPRLQLGHMEVQVSDESQEAEDQVTYLYTCASINGINQAVVSRANELATLSARGENLVAACAVLSAEETQTLEEANMLARKFVELDLSEGNDTRTARDMLEGIFRAISE